MKPTKIDKLFALKALEKKIGDERKLTEYECRDELLEAFEKDGTDRRTSPYFGADAGKFSIKRTKGKPAKETQTFENTDWDLFSDWLEMNPDAAKDFCFLRYAEFSEWWVAKSGELPDGIDVKKVTEPATEGSVSAQVYSFKPDLVIEKLATNGNLFEGANQLLLSEGDE